MGPEAKLYKKLKNKLPQISWIRLENNSLLGTPDLLGYNNSGVFFTVELKVTKGNKVRFSPHQIAVHVKHPNNTFICIEHLGSGAVKLFRGSRIKELVACVNFTTSYLFQVTSGHRNIYSGMTYSITSSTIWSFCKLV